MEVNREEAVRCLSIAQRHRSASNLPSAWKFAKKSISLYATPEGNALLRIIEREISTGGSSSSSEANGNGHDVPFPPGYADSSAKASGVEEHMSSAHHRAAAKGDSGSASAGPSKGASAGPSKATSNGDAAPKKREYTAKQMEVVVRVKKCKHHEYYEILAGACDSVRKEWSPDHSSGENMRRERCEAGLQEGQLAASLCRKRLTSPARTGSSSR